MSAMITIPLDLPDVIVENTEITRDGEYVITVKSTLGHTTCRECQEEITRFHAHDAAVTLRHLSILGAPVYIRYRPRRYQCPHCPGRPTTTQQVVWHERRSPNTKPYEQYVLLQLVNNTVQDVSLKEGLSYDTVEGIIDRHIASEVDWDQVVEIGVLGLDEVARRKGRSDFIVIVSVRLADGTVKILAVLPNRHKKTVKKFLRSIPERLRQTIHTVCSDMYQGYINAAQEVLNKDRAPDEQVVIVVDRFHVAQKYHACVDSLRSKVCKRLKQELSQEDYDPIKGVMWPVRKRKADLTAEEAKKLEHLFELAPELKQAYDFREELTAIFDGAHSKEQATRLILDWKDRVVKSSLTCFKSFLKTLDNFLHEITNYFIDRHTSGFVEGLNNKLKVLKRRCYGILNLKHIFQRLYLDFEGYRTFT